MAQDDGAVAGEVQIGFDAGGAGVESGLEGGQRVFRPEAAGAAVALEFERPVRGGMSSGKKEPRREKYLPARPT